MKVGIITCMTCISAVALTMGGPIRKQISQSEKTVPVGGYVTLLCPFSHDDTWIWVYWKKNNHTIYSLHVPGNTPWTNDTRYEVGNHAKSLTIKDLQDTDSGIYHCKVSTAVNIEEGGHVMISVTDQEGGLSNTSPGVPFRESTTIPLKRTEDITIILSTIVSFLITIIIMFLAFKYRKRIMDSKFVRPCRRLAPTRTAPTPVPAAPNHEKIEASTMTDPTPVPAASTLVPAAPNHEIVEASTMTFPTPVPAASTLVPAAPNHEIVEQESPTIISDQTDMSSRAPNSTTSSRLDASAPCNLNSCSTPLLNRSAQHGSPANISDQTDISSSAQDSRPTTSSRLDFQQGSPANISDQADIPLRAQHSWPITSSRLHPSAPRDLNFHSTPLPHSRIQHGSPANISDQTDISSSAQDSRPTTFSRLDVSAPRDPNSPSTPLLNRSAQQESPANMSDQADGPLRAPDSTTSSSSDTSAPRDQNSSSTPLLHSSTQARRSTFKPLTPDSSHHETRDQTSERGETQLPLVGPVLIDDLCRVSVSKRKSIEKRMTLVIHDLVRKNRDEGVPPKGGEYSASLREYASSGNRCVPNRVLKSVEYFLDELDNIPVGCKRDVCEILSTMPQNQELVPSMMTFSNKDTDDQVRAASHKLTSRTPILREQIRNILADSETRDAARYGISLIILDASPVESSGSASFSQQIASSYYQPANETEQETGIQSQSKADLKHEEDNLIEFWLSKVMQLDPAVQRTVSDRFAVFDHGADSSSKLQQGSQAKICVQADNSLRASDTTSSSRLDTSGPCDPICCSTPALSYSSAQEKTLDRPDTINDDAKELKNNFNERTDQDKVMGRRNMPNNDAKEERNINLNDKTILVPQPSKALWPPALDLNRLTREQLTSLIHDSYAPTSNEQGSAKPGRLKDEIKGPKIKQIYAKDEEKAIAGPDMQNHDVKELMNTNLKKSTELNKKSIEMHGEKEKG